MYSLKKMQLYPFVLHTLLFIGAVVLYLSNGAGVGVNVVGEELMSSMSLSESLFIF